MARPILTPDEMRAAEQAVFDTGVPSLDVMRRAGRAAAEFLHAHWPAGRIQVLCGPGGNGGDGFVAAQCLKDMWRQVDVFSARPVEALTGDAAQAAREWAGPVLPLESALEAPHDIVLDALYGAGLSRPLEGAAAVLAQRGGRVISVDVPSGIDGLSARPLGPAFRAEGTVTFAALRPAHVLLPAAEHCGHVFMADIGVPVTTRLHENGPGLWFSALPRPGLAIHKHQRGHLKIVSGGPYDTGAARLAAIAGLRAGAGLVTVLSPVAALDVNAAHLTAVMLDGFSTAESLSAAAGNAAVVIIGPAAGVSRETRANIEALLRSPASLILDADALTVYADDPAALFRQLRPGDILTPHLGEFRRLFGDLDSRAPNKVEAVREAAGQAGCAVLLKGPDTVIAQPDGQAIVNTHAVRWLATAGSGDVLAGIIGGLMAQGLSPFMAAAIGTWIHGEAGRRIGAGLIAEDLPGQLPEILTALYGE